MTGTKENRRVVIIGGPTAGGKSGLALDLARRTKGTIINADSMQVYQGLPRLTAQPDTQEYATAPHKLYACLSPQDACTAARFCEMASTEIEKTLAEGRLPVVVGGTGLYITALTQGLSPIPAVPPDIRADAVARQKELGNPAFHALLKTRDAQTADGLDPMNTQRLIRAWEVLEATGKGLAVWQAQPRIAPAGGFSFLHVILLPPRKVLYTRCNARFQKMIASGVIEEVRAFHAANFGAVPLAKALGYQPLVDHLSGALSLDDAIRKSCTDTRHYAKRQTTWFRHQIKPDIFLEKPDIDACLRGLKI